MHCMLLGKLVCAKWFSLVLPCLSPANSSLSSQLLDVNKQWDQHFRSMKQQYEQKVVWGLPGVKAEARFPAVLSVHRLFAASFSAALNLGRSPSRITPSLPLTPDH